MATLRWYGGQVADKVAKSAEFAVDRTMAECVSDAKDNHPGYPPPSEPYARFHSRTGFEVGSIVIFKPAILEGDTVSGQWGGDSGYTLFLEIGTSTDGPTAGQRTAAAAGEMGLIPPPIGPLMAPRPFLRPAMDREYPLLASRIAALYRGDPMP